MNDRRSAFSLIEILVVVVIMIALSAFLLPRLIGPAKVLPNGKRASTPMSRAHDTECVANIRSVRQAIEVAKVGADEGKFPASLADLKLPKEVIFCTTGKQQYKYDSQTGTVSCTTVGHETY